MWSSASRLLYMCVVCCFMTCNVCLTMFPFYRRGFLGQQGNVQFPFITGSAWQESSSFDTSSFDTSSFNSGNVLQRQSKCYHPDAPFSGSAGNWDRVFPHDDVCAYCNRKVWEHRECPNFCRRYSTCVGNSPRNSGVRCRRNRHRFVPTDISRLVCDFCKCIANEGNYSSCYCSLYCGQRSSCFW